MKQSVLLLHLCLVALQCSSYSLTRFGMPTSTLLRAGASSSSDLDDPSPVVELSSPSAAVTRALILMDCFCPYHGLYLAQRIQQDYPDVALVFTLSHYLHGYLQMAQPDESARWNAARLPSSVASWKHKLDGLELVGVYCESDSGLHDAEWLRAKLGVACQDNPPQLEARRHKYYMNEVVAKAGLATVQQKLCQSLSEAHAFGQELLAHSDRVVVKPHRGVATESVYLCSTMEDITRAWEGIVSTKVFGSAEEHSSVLMQEFLTGTEYAVDVVARNGDYKVAAIWRYEKKAANGAPFCYFRTQLVDDPSDANVRSVVDYVKASLKALGVAWGLSHNEVIFTDDRGPVLIEINCRQHNMDFMPLTMACIGYNALDMTAVALLDEQEAWNQIPDMPTLQAGGCMVHLVNYASGKLHRVRFLDDLASLPSVMNWEVYEDFLEAGTEIKPTIDIRTDAGWAQLVNSDLEQQERDYQAIVQWMPSMFEVE